ncbi:MCE family protein [Nocardia thailandica]
MGRLVKPLAPLAVTVLFAAGCGITVEDLPLPEPGAGADTYTLHAEFENALNLPDQAKVKIGGSDVGVVSAITTRNFVAVIDMQIRTDIVLPKGSTAELRQATPLGDVFVALSEPRTATGAGRLEDGDTLTLASTSAGASVEELLISVSMLFNGGGVSSLSRLGTELGAILKGQGGNLAHLITESTGVIGELNANSARIDSVLTEFDTLANTIDDSKVQLGQVADTLPQAIGAIAENTDAITDLLAKVSVASAAVGDYSATTGDQLSSLLTSLTDLMNALAASGDSFGYTMEQLHLIRPGADASLRGKSLSVFATLTNLDIGLLTDPEHSRFYTLADVNDLVGTFIQVLQVVQGRLNPR